MYNNIVKQNGYQISKLATCIQVVNGIIIIKSFYIVINT